MAKVSPSILSADFMNMERDIKMIEASGADYIHVDIMDGSFVPNISIGIPVVEALRKVTDMVLDVHLMIVEPIRYVERFCKAGADILTVHIEADTLENTVAALDKIRELGVRPAICVKPKTPAEAVLPLLHKCSLCLCMTVEPGFGGQKFMEDMMPKVSAISNYIKEHNLDCEVEVDGGINEQTAVTVCNAGANVLVAGSAFFKAPDKAAFTASLQNH